MDNRLKTIRALRLEQRNLLTGPNDTSTRALMENVFDLAEAYMEQIIHLEKENSKLIQNFEEELDRVNNLNIILERKLSCYK